ncbi:MAG: hypothetical protein IKT62_07070 [Firmicutes bacterium]|nr:hypothetical protein [Bacillota bacterium]
MATNSRKCWSYLEISIILTTEKGVKGEKMRQIKEKVEFLLAEMIKEEKKANNELNLLPKGELHQVLRNNKMTYFQVTKEDGKRVRKSINRKPEVISALARKMYLKREIRLLEQNIHYLSSISSKLENVTPDNIMSKLPLKIAHFLEKEDDWQNQDYKRSNYKLEELKHTTSRGLKVRSKSEVIIAEALYAHGIQFRYEEVLWIDGHQFIPDFKILTPSRKVFYWEHCGMVNNPQYMKHHKDKMEQYEKIGIVPWKNLIVTYDTEEGIIDTNIIISEIINKLK